MGLGERQPQRGWRRLWRALAATLVVALATTTIQGSSCDKSTRPRAPASVRAQSGDGQSGTVGEVLAGPVTVLVLDERGQPLSGAAVAFSTPDSGTVAPASATTGAQGTASASWTLGPRAGTQRLSASLPGGASVQLSASARPGPTTKVRHATDSVALNALGDTLTLQPSALDRFGNAVTGVAFSFSSDDPSIALVSATGMLTAVAAGRTSVEARADTARVRVVVVVRQLPARLQLSPRELSFAAVGDSAWLTAAVHDGRGHPIPGLSVAWTSRDGSVASVRSGGLVHALGRGSTYVVASGAAFSDSARVTVVPRAVRLALRPDTLRLGWLGATDSLVVSATDARGSPIVGARPTWSTGSAAVATVDSSGRVTAVGEGTTSISAQLDELTASAVVVVRVGTVRVVVSPDVARLESLGETVHLSASALDGAGRPLSGRAFQFSSLNSVVASVASDGTVTAAANGQTGIVAASPEGPADTAQITVAQTPTRVTLLPASVVLHSLGQTVQLVGTAYDRLGAAIPGAVNWASSAPAVAKVDAAGKVTALAGGSATITAFAGSASATAAVTVQQVPAAITLAPATATLNWLGQTVALTPTVRDSLGQLIGSPGTISWSSSAAAIATATGGTVTALTPGTATITAALGAVTAGADVTVRQVPATVTATPASITLSAIGATSSLAVVVSDTGGSAIPGLTPAFTSSDGSKATVNAAGTVSAVANGSATVTITAAPASTSVPVTVAQAIATVTVSPKPWTFASLNETRQFAAQAVDANGHAVAGATAAWSSTDPAVVSIDAASGLATAHANGTARIVAGYATPNVKADTASVTVAQVATSLAIVSGDGATPVVASGHTLVAKPADALGSGVPGVTVSWATTSGSLPASSTSDAAGNATATWTIGTAVGTQTATASAAGLSGSPLTFTVSARPAAASQLTLSTQPSATADAGVAFARQPTVQLRDAYGNAVAQTGVTIDAVLASGSPALAGGTSATTDAAGLASFTTLAISGSAGDRTIAFQSGTLTAVTSSTVTVRAGAAASLSKSAGDGQSATVASAVGVAPVVLVRDAWGNAVAGASVTFTVSAGGGTLAGGSPAVVTSAADGTATSPAWTLGSTAGANALQASMTGLTSIAFSATGTAAAAHHLTVETQPSSTAQAGLALARQPAVQLRDSYGNAVAQSGVTVSAAAAGVTLGGTTSVSTGAAGLATFADLSLAGTAGSYTLAFSAASLGGATSASIALQPGAATTASSTISPATATLVADGSSTRAITVQLKDAWGNNLTAGGAAVALSVSGGGTLAADGSTAASVTAHDNGDGSYTATYTAPAAVGTGTATITGTVGGAALAASSVITLTAGALHHFLVEAAAGGSIGTQTAGSAFNVKITAQDATNNTVTGFTGTADVTSNRTGSAGLTTTAAFTAGVLASHTVTLTQSGASSTIAATKTGSTETGTSDAFTVGAAALHHFTVEAAGGGAIAAQTAGTSFNVRITAQDQYANTVAGFTGTVDVTSNRTGSAGLTTTAGFTAGVLASHAITLTQSGTSSTITATKTGSTETGTSAAFTVSPASASTLARSAGDGQSATAGSAVAVAPRVRITDAYGNALTGVSVRFTVAGGGGSLSGGSPFDTATDASGYAAVRGWTLGTTAGANALDAASTGLTTVSFSATGTAGTLHHFAVEAAGGGSIATQTAGSSFSVRITAQDINNNTVPTFTGTVDVTSNRTGSAGLTTSAAFTAGVLSSHAVTLTQSGASSTISATKTGSTETGTSNSFTVNAGPPSAMVKTAGDGQSATVGTAVATAPRIQALDAYGNAVPGVSVRFTISAGGGAISGGAPFDSATDASGYAAVRGWTLGTTTGSNGLEGASAGLATVTFTATGAAGAAHHLALSVQPSASVAAGAVLAQQPVVQIQDQYNNAVAQSGVSVTASSSGGTLSGTKTVATVGAGSATFTDLVLAGTVGGYTLSFAAGTLTGVTSNSITLSVGAATSLAIDAGNGGSTTVGTARTIQAKVTDAGGNPVSGTNVSFHVTAGAGSLAPAGGGASADPLVVATDASGLAAAAWTIGTTAGANTATATSGTLSGSPLTFSATGTAGAAASLAKSAGDGQSANLNTAVATAPRVRVTDSYGNGVSGVSVRFTIASGGGTLAGGSPFDSLTDASGYAAVRSWTLGGAAGANTLTAASTGLTTVTFSATAINPNTPPVAVNDSYNSVGNVTLTVAAPGVLGNDTDAEGNTLTVLAADRGTRALTHGSLTLNADGSFTYTPTAGYTGGSDSFTYHAYDGTVSSTSAATVTINVAGLFWFVNKAAAAGGTGTQAAPFQTISEAITAAGSDTILVVRAGTAYDEGLSPKAGQKIYGQGTATNVTASVGGSTVTLLSGLGTGNPTVVTRTSGTALSLPGSGTVTLRGLSIGSSSGKGVYGSSFGTLAATDVSVTGTGARALDLTSGAANATFRSVSANGGDYGIYLSGVTGTLTVTGDGANAGSGGTLQNQTAKGVMLTNVGTVSLSFMNIRSPAWEPVYVLASTSGATTRFTFNDNRVGAFGSNPSSLAGVYLNASGGATLRATVSRDSLAGGPQQSGLAAIVQAGSKVVLLASFNHLNDLGMDGAMFEDNGGNIQATFLNNTVRSWSTAAAGMWGAIGGISSTQACVAISGNDVVGPSSDPGWLAGLSITMQLDGTAQYKHTGTSTTTIADIAADNTMNGTAAAFWSGSPTNNNNASCEQP